MAEGEKRVLKEMNLGNFPKISNKPESLNIRTKLISAMGNDLFKQMYDFMSGHRSKNTAEGEVR